MKKISILMVLGNTGRGGAQTFAVNVLRAIDRKKYHIDFVVNEAVEDGYTDEIRKLGGEIYIIPYYRVYNHRQYVNAWKNILKTKKYDIVHGNVSSSAVVYLKCAKKYGCATIAHSHSAGYRGNKIEMAIKRIFTFGAKYQADYWFACSDKAALRLFGKKYLEYEKYYYVPNAILTSKFKYDANTRKRIRKLMGIDDDTYLFGHIGSFTAPKNHIFLLEIFKEILNKKDNAKLVLIGDGELHNQIISKINELGIQDNVVLTGNIANANEYMMAIDEMIFPSLFEGFPISVLEAQATGAQVLLSDTITNEVFLTENIYPISLAFSAEQWAKIALEKCKAEINKSKSNKIISETIYNVENSIKILSELYIEMSHK